MPSLLNTITDDVNSIDRFPRIEWSCEESLLLPVTRKQGLRRQLKRKRRASGLVRSQHLLCLTSAVEPSHVSDDETDKDDDDDDTNATKALRRVGVPSKRLKAAISSPLVPLSCRKSCIQENDSPWWHRHYEHTPADSIPAMGHSKFQPPQQPPTNHDSVVSATCTIPPPASSYNRELSSNTQALEPFLFDCPFPLFS